MLSYVDPYASSASEMITEMIQYVDDNIKIKAFEADALYAGINIDTDGFNSKSGPRTFEAAAFLRRHGADVTRVRKMLRNDMDEYKAVAHAVSRAEVYRDAFAIASLMAKDWKARQSVVQKRQTSFWIFRELKPHLSLQNIMKKFISVQGLLMRSMSSLSWKN